VTAEIIGLKDLSSALSITWLVLVLPTTCEFPISASLFLLSWKLLTPLVSEPIALEIVSFNSGSYLGAQLFAGFMYIGAAFFMWVIRAWKLGEMEMEDALDASQKSGILEKPSGETAPRRAVKSSSLKRMFMWRKV
jgi:hypothetical protein